jgi:hypothetical protein
VEKHTRCNTFIEKIFRYQSINNWSGRKSSKYLLLADELVVTKEDVWLIRGWNRRGGRIASCPIAILLKAAFKLRDLFRTQGLISQGVGTGIRIRKIRNPRTPSKTAVQCVLST